ncbi:hypothetical protein BaRGS_00002800 [Batillaria attramentaria]|uniref:Reverse transcriptase domain-containing protein n=1 Tax=Batillaria attramentaria TaxID=370345 RepID=A0ABD0M314_9CAEN
MKRRTDTKLRSMKRNETQYETKQRSTKRNEMQYETPDRYETTQYETKRNETQYETPDRYETTQYELTRNAVETGAELKLMKQRSMKMHLCQALVETPLTDWTRCVKTVHIAVSTMMEFAEENQIVCEEQYGFRHGRSCESQLLDLLVVDETSSQRATWRSD